MSAIFRKILQLKISDPKWVIFTFKMLLCPQISTYKAETWHVIRHVSKLAAAANFAFPRNSRFFVLRVATFKTVYVFNIAKTIFREMLTVFLYIVLIRKSRLIIHMQILMMRNDYQANKKEPKLRSTKSSSNFFQ